MIISFYIILMTFCIKNLIASHFRGGTIMWKPVSIDDISAIIDVTIKLGFRRSHGLNYFCDQKSINKKSTIGDPGLNVLPGVLSLPFFGVYCTDFSEIEDWSYGQITVPVKYNFTTTSKTRTYEIRYSGGDWINLVNGGSSWNLISRVNLNTQAHTNKINQSPVTSMSPLLSVPVDCYKEIKIPVFDNDGDFIRCRWSVNKECGDFCGSLSSVIELDEKNCVLKFTLSEIGFYALRIQIEDFASDNSLDPLSSVPLDFLIQTYSQSSCTVIKPTFEYPTREDGACISIPLGFTYTDQILVNSNDALNPIQEIKTISPNGLVKSELYTLTDTIKYINVSWTPKTQDINIFCFIGITQSYISTDQRCLSLAVGFTEPAPIKTTITPSGIIYSNHTEWSVSVNQNLSRPLIESFLNFIDNLTNSVVYQVSSNDYTINENSIKFTTDKFLENDKSYYITFDYGFFQSNIGCKLLSKQLNDLKFWSFSVRDCFKCNLIHGKCIDIEKCECETNWSGENCDLPLCLNDCNNNGVCENRNICNCYQGFNGTFCENDVCKLLNDCSKNGVCNNNRCKCNKGWTGEKCDIPVCMDNCNNNGKCIESNLCECFEDFTGYFCEKRKCSSFNNCSNHGVCMKNEECFCDEGWTKDDCSESINIDWHTLQCDENCFKFNCLSIFLLSIICLLLIVLFFIVWSLKTKKRSVFALNI